jgi:hypothetical protein
MMAYLAKLFQAGRYMLAILGLALLLVVLFIVLRIGVFYSVYTWLFAHVFTLTGLDVWLSRALTIAILGVVSFLGWRFVLLPWSAEGRKWKAILFGVVVFALIGVELATKDVYFSRPDGRPLKYYIRTLDGYSFAAAPGTDPLYGLRYQPITPEVAREYLLWKRRAGELRDPSVPENQYFDSATGEPVRWYARLPGGQIQMFTLPGFHPRYGTKLEPVTLEVIAEYEKQETTQAAASGKSVRLGRYLFAKHDLAGTVANLRFRLTEVDVTSDSLLIHLEVEHLVRLLADWTPSISFALLTEDGQATAPDETRITDGAMTYGRDGSVHFPPAGRNGRFVAEFRDLTGVRRFSFTINTNPLFGTVDLTQADFRAF